MRAVRKRSKSRGAAMVEALVVIPCLAVLNGGLFYMLHVYDAKLTTIRNVNEASWTQAVSSCQGGATSSKATPSAGSTDSALSGVQSQASQALQLSVSQNVKKPFQQLQFKMYGTTSDKQADGNTLFTGGETYTSDATVLCNEKPQALTKADEKQQVDDFYNRFVK